MRNELLYQSQALFVGPTPCTGQHFQSGQNFIGSGINWIKELFRVVRYGNTFDIPLEPVTQLGQLAPFSMENNTAPTPKWTLEMYTSDGTNESSLGLPIDGVTPILSGLFASTTDDKNYFGLITPEGTDADGNTVTAAQYVECMGNGYISSIRYSASVGGFAMTTIDVEGSNYVSYSGSTGLTNPAINPYNGSIVTTSSFTIPEPAVSGSSPFQPTVLKYGDVTINMGTTAGLLGAIFATGTNAAHIQSFDLTIPVTREPILQLGNKYPYARKIRPPLIASLSVTAIMNELQTGNLANVINSCGADGPYNMYINFLACSGVTKVPAFNITVLGGYMNSEDFSIGVGQRKTVNARFSIPIGGPSDNIHQIIISGIYNGVGSFWPITSP